MIWIGANDVRDGLIAAGDPDNLFTTDEIFEAALFAIASHISNLWMAGARKFLVLNVPDLSITPVILSELPDVQGFAQFLMLTFNSKLATTLDGLEALPGVKITRLEVFTLLNSVVANPRAFGFQNVSEPCLTFFVAEDFFVQKTETLPVS